MSESTSVSRPVIVVCCALLSLCAAGPARAISPQQTTAYGTDSIPPGRSSFEADTFRDEAARELIRRARAERGREAAGLASWESTIRERISVGLTTQDIRRERGLFTSERVGRVRWDSTGVETIRWFGIRRAVPIAGEGAEIEVEPPENLIEFPVDPAGDRLVLAGSPFHHPLADDAGVYYRFASGDTMRVILPSGEEVVLALEDSGPGVGEEQLQHLFDRFYRVEGSRSRATGGSGLGLAICRNIVEAHGGAISAGHSPLGGLAIRVSLPAFKEL